MDEARLGPAPRAATRVDPAREPPGHRPARSNYPWECLCGALGVVSGEAHFAHLPGVSLEWDQSCLRDLAASDPRGPPGAGARPGPGIHLREGDARLPERVRIIGLPPCRPQLNPCERLRAHHQGRHWQSKSKPRSVPCARRCVPRCAAYWEDTRLVLRLIGRDWLPGQLNAAWKTPVSV